LEFVHQVNGLTESGYNLEERPKPQKKVKLPASEKKGGTGGPGPQKSIPVATDRNGVKLILLAGEK